MHTLQGRHFHLTPVIDAINDGVASAGRAEVSVHLTMLLLHLRVERLHAIIPR